MVSSLSFHDSCFEPHRPFSRGGHVSRRLAVVTSELALHNWLMYLTAVLTPCSAGTAFRVDQFEDDGIQDAE